MVFDWMQDGINNNSQEPAGEKNASPCVDERKGIQVCPQISNVSRDSIESESPIKAVDILTTAPPEHQRCDLYGEIAVFGVSLRGRSHVKSGAPCQDSNDFIYLHQEEILIAAIADGVGSCSLSHWGAYTAVQEAINSVRDSIVQIANGQPVKISNLSQAQIEEVFNKAFLHAQSKVEDLADRYQQSVVHFQSTLTVALYDGNRVACCHIGDDGIVAQGTSGKYQMITKRIKGEEANSVFTLQSGRWYITTTSTDITGFLMSTDGILDFYVTNEGMGNRVYYPFLHNFLYGMKPKNGKDLRSVVENTMQSTIDFLNSDDRISSVTDDMTILAIANQRHLCEATMPSFSQSEWEAELKRIREKQLEELNASKTIIPPRKQERMTQPKFAEGATANPNKQQSCGASGVQNRGQFSDRNGRDVPPRQKPSSFSNGSYDVYSPTANERKKAGSPYETSQAPYSPTGNKRKKTRSPYENSQNPYVSPIGKGQSYHDENMTSDDAEDIGFLAMLGEEFVEFTDEIYKALSGIFVHDEKYKCQYCGNKVTKNERYCGVCQRAISWVCPDCGAPIRTGAPKCAYCKHQIFWGCPTCGYPIRNGAKKCGHCGHSIIWR